MKQEQVILAFLAEMEDFLCELSAEGHKGSLLMSKHGRDNGKLPINRLGKMNFDTTVLCLDSHCGTLI